MKISKLFHSLYAILMFLPVMVIPIFAININQKSVEPIQVEVQENKEIIFNQKIDLSTNENYTKVNSYELTFENSNILSYTTLYLSNQFNNTHKYLISNYLLNSNNGTFYFYRENEGNQIYTSMQRNTFQQQIVNLPNNFSILALNSEMQTYEGSLKVNVFDLTQMFGEGNEPTINEFNDMFPVYFYNFELAKKELIADITTIYNDTDIGSQFLYSLYIPVHDYFNIVNWMNLGGLYDWFLLNIFNGVNALVIEIIFNLIVYWLMVSFVWLIFDVLMYVPSMIHKMLDKARME